jgi:CheY-like chemotaxis protein
MNKKVLIVEDDEIIRQLLEWRLNSLGYSVCGKAATAEEAIICAKEKKPDVVIMDIHLTGQIDGIDAAVAIKKMYPLPVIFLTAYSNEEDLERAKMVPPDGYILKPFNDTDLRVALTLALANPIQELSINRVLPEFV